MLNDAQRDLLTEAHDLIKAGKEMVIFLAIRRAFNADVTDATDADVLALHYFINEDVIASIRNGADVGAMQRLCGMSRPGDATVVAERLEWIESLLKEGGDASG
jgi:hypothetical protein